MKISVFTPTHKPDFLPEVYKSLQRQSYKNWEWVIAYNNGAKPYGFDDERVKEHYLEYPTNEWVGPLKHYACSKCTGEIMLELDHDDLLTDDALEEVAKAFSDSEIGFVYSNTIHATGDYKKVERFDTRYGWDYREVEWKGHKLDEHISFPPAPDCISKIWFAPNHLRAWRKELYDAIGGHSKDMRVLDDLDLMCRMYPLTKFKHIDKGLYIYRVHGENTWLRYNKEIQDNVHRIHDKYIADLVDRWCDLNGLKKIELGGAFHARPGYIRVDLHDADVVVDLDRPWPFKDSSVGVIRAFDIFEHLKSPLHTMRECFRVLAPGGWVISCTPSTDGRGAFADPTHVSFWNENSFHYYTKTSRGQYIGTPVRFQAARLWTTALNSDKTCWVNAHLCSLKDGYRPAGLVEI